MFTADRVELIDEAGQKGIFDYVFLACHSDQALEIISKPSKTEINALSKISYQENSVVLHSDIRLLPKREKAWSSWNYLLNDTSSDQATLTYNMNILQGLESETVFCVSVNSDHLIDKNKIFEKFTYYHPVFSLHSDLAKSEIKKINGNNRTFFTGAYLSNGFHEDGLRSAIESVFIFKENEKQNL